MATQANGAVLDADSQTIADLLTRITEHQSAGRLDEADVLLDTGLLQYPDNVKLTHYKALNLLQRGAVQEGRSMMELALSELPDDPVQLTDYGVHLAQSGDMRGAIEQFTLATEAAPNYGVAHSNLGAALLMVREPARAIEHLEKAVALEPHLLDAHTNLGVAYLQTHKLNDAVNILFKALSIDPQSLAAHTQLSAALYRRERYEAAEHHARRAIELHPTAREPQLHLGNALAASGKMEEAAQAFLKVTAGDAMGLQELSRLIHLRKTKEGAPELAELHRHLAARETLTEEQKATLGYAAGKAFDDLGDYRTAFSHFHTANEITKTLHEFDAQAVNERAARMLEFCSPALMTRCAGGGVRDIAPIFICGMPRSGTTLMDQMFSRHPQVQAGGELHAVQAALAKNTRIHAALEEKRPDTDIVADDFSQLGETYGAAVRNEGIRSERFTDKMPSNFRYIGLLALALPRAKFLIMRRHPMDCLLSNYMQHFGANQPFSSDFDNLAAAYKEFDMTAKAWAKALPDRVREVSYEAVTQDAESQMRAVLDFVGLDWSADVLDYKASFRQVNTASQAQIREPIYTRSVARWRQYAQDLRPLAERLQAYLSEDDLRAYEIS